MRNVLALAIVAITAAPFIGIWRGHLWAKTNALVPRKLGIDSTPGEIA